MKQLKQNYDFNSHINQSIKRKFIEREVYCNVCSMTEYILNKSWDDNDAPFNYDDIENYYMSDDTIKDYYGVTTDEEIEDIRDNGEDKQEIFEWWVCSNFLIGKLAEKGEPVIEHEQLWGRTCTGQAILLDGVISEICSEMEILEGQKYTWEKEL